ncbi:ROK family protein [Vagococcus salmoninarum]|uniref:ROK family protein n=1 Tax=Vagococcus salmoninarum TaxID=2739 RepID=UPI0018820239|nr:ROK family protein [Vagococcus salmoninarum]MBE9388203.1 ROK family protein [Vagococcus salmoninarum]
MEYMSFDIGGTSIKYGVVTSLGEILLKAAFPTPQSRGAIVSGMYDVLQSCQKKYPKISGIGISAPGMVADDGTLIVAGAIDSLYGANLKQELGKYTDLPISIENDANSAAIAEQWVGNAQGTRNYICLVLGTGLGGGVVIDSKLYRGRHNLAGEFGFSLIEGVSSSGELESNTMNYKGAVVLGLISMYEEALAKEKIAVPKKIDAREIFTKANQGESIALAVLKKYYENLSILCLNIMSFFDPDKILIGGGISANNQFMTELLDTFESLFARHTSLANIGRENAAEIIPAKLLNDAGLIGAAYNIYRQINY